MATSGENRSALEAWKRQPKINSHTAKRDQLQTELNALLAGEYSPEAEAKAKALRTDIGILNKKIGSMQSRANKPTSALVQEGQG